MMVSKTRVKMQEKRKKNARKIKNASPMRNNVSILHYALGKNASQLRFSRVFLVFYLRFTCVFLAFLFTNANQKHSVIGALHSLLKFLLLRGLPISTYAILHDIWTTSPLFACNTQKECIGDLTPHPPRCVRTKWKPP